MNKELSESEQKARVKYKGLTRRQFNSQYSKFAGHRPKSENGSFEIVALFNGNPAPQTAPFPNEAAALTRFDVLRGNPAAHSIKIVKNVVEYGADGRAKGLRPTTIYSLTRSGQEFANSKVELLYRRKGGNDVFNMKHILSRPELAQLMLRGELEVAKRIITGGTPWWASKA